MKCEFYNETTDLYWRRQTLNATILLSINFTQSSLKMNYGGRAKFEKLNF